MKPEQIIVHCSASKWGNVIEIDRWHRARGWRAIGYHVVILNGMSTAQDAKRGDTVRILDGAIQVGRALDADADLEAHEMGAHVYGFNKTTIGMCLIGVDKFTRNQIVNSVKVVKFWQELYGIETAKVKGHYEMPTAKGKTCPNIDMNLYRELVDAKTASMRLLASFNTKGFRK